MAGSEGQGGEGSALPQLGRHPGNRDICRVKGRHLWPESTFPPPATSKHRCKIRCCSPFFPPFPHPRPWPCNPAVWLSEAERISHPTEPGLGCVIYSGRWGHGVCHGQSLKMCSYSWGWAFALLTLPGEKHALGGPCLPEERETRGANLNPACREAASLAPISLTRPSQTADRVLNILKYSLTFTHLTMSA